ncbi:hypothetical protein ACFFKU_04825 [Kineococcus gynurae]|uniref:Mannosyltransferase PIG-V n=1 Tax=Kineococcus gynurae TaxID=452979 RepID=A0ABV5LNB0_9ACTN
MTRRRLVLAWLRAPVIVQVLLVYAAARVFSAVVIAEVARFQAESVWTSADPGYTGMLGIWDAVWYREIAEDGYPSSVPLGADGRPQQSALAFYPVFPLLARALSAVTGLDFAVSGSVVALVTGAGAAVLVHRVLHEAVLRAGGRPATARRAAWSAAVLFCVSPVSPVLQVAYTEGPAMLLLAGFLLLLLRRAYLPAAVLALVLGLTRPVALPLTAVVVVHLGLRALRAHRGGARRPPTGVAVRAAVLLAASGTAGLLWPGITWWLTGRRDAYTATMGAWRSSGEVVPFVPWVSVSQYLLGDLVGPVLLLLLLGLAAFFLLSARTAVLGLELRVWCLAYSGYLLAVLDPFTSLFRYLMLLFPLGGLVALHPRRRGALRATVVACLLLQIVWTAWLWRFSPPADWPP